MPRWHTSETRCSRCTSCKVPASLYGLLADALTQENVCVIEVLEKLGKKHVAICNNGLLNSIEDGVIHALWVVGRFEQVRRNRPDEHGCAQALSSVCLLLTCHLVSTHRDIPHRHISQRVVSHD